MLRSFDKLDDLNRFAADRFRDIAARSIAERGSFFVALAGGSTPMGLYALLAEPPYSSDIAWERAEVFFGDERWVPPDHPESNFGSARTILLSKLPLVPSQTHPILTMGPSPRDAALAYEETIKARFGHHAPRFDLILLGLGTDGHTASLFPHSSHLSTDNRLVVETEAPVAATPTRITMTLPLLNSARNIVFLVSGGDKGEALAQVFSDRSSTDEFPAKSVKPEDGEVTWLVSGVPIDQASAQSK